MPLRFAAASPAVVTFAGRERQQRLMLRAANDNHSGKGQDTLLRDALKHFATHGLGAAQVARGEAERAFFAGDRQAYTHWLGICRALDRRLAATFSAEMDKTSD